MSLNIEKLEKLQSDAVDNLLAAKGDEVFKAAALVIANSMLVNAAYMRAVSEEVKEVRKSLNTIDKSIRHK